MFILEVVQWFIITLQRYIYLFIEQIYVDIYLIKLNKKIPICIKQIGINILQPDNY